ncbi:imelysin family protein [Tenacibaculum sp.]|uniref:imelysin family protein n=1 Tax=Tenacibaculum sp. TaxID=1906242 RepID=UPI003D0C34FB
MIKKITSIFLLALLISCSSDNTEPTNSFNVKQLRVDIINSVEAPVVADFSESITQLNNSIITFANTVNEQNLNLLKEAWKQAAANYSLIEVLNIGDIKDSFIQTAFYSWSANESAIESYIASTNEISKEAFNSVATNTRGLSAIEFLIYEKSVAETLEDFKNTRRLKYLKTLGENLEEKITTYTSLWDNFKDTFIENNATGINGGVNQVVNSMYALLEDVKSFKIGQPAGIEKTTAVDATLLQAEKSSYSLFLIEQNLEGIKKLYFGDENGLDDYVFSITNTQELNNRIEAQFETLNTILLKLKTTSLKEALVNEKEEVTNLYNAVRDLLVLLKSDVASTLSVIITVTDNDGD